MVFSSHLFVFYFLPLALLALLRSAAARPAPRADAAELPLLRLGQPALRPADVRLDGDRLRLRAGSPAVPHLVARFGGGDRADRAAAAGRGTDARQKAAVVVSVLANLSLLGFFKYFNFGVDSYNGLVALLGLHALRRRLGAARSPAAGHQLLHLPVDELRDRRLPRRRPAALRRLHRFRLLRGDVPAAGGRPDRPLLGRRRPARASRRHTLEKFARGVAFFAFGMAKKMLLANPCGQVADAAFDAGSLRAAGRLDRRGRLRLPDLLRLLRLLATWRSASG